MAAAVPSPSACHQGRRTNCPKPPRSSRPSLTCPSGSWATAATPTTYSASTSGTSAPGLPSRRNAMKRQLPAPPESTTIAIGWGGSKSGVPCHALRENRSILPRRPLPRRITRLAQAITDPKGFTRITSGYRSFFWPHRQPSHAEYITAVEKDYTSHITSSVRRSASRPRHQIINPLNDGHYDECPWRDKRFHTEVGGHTSTLDCQDG